MIETFNRGDRVVVVSDSDHPEYVGREGRVVGHDVGMILHVGEDAPRTIYNVVLDGRATWDIDGFYPAQLELAGEQREAA